MNFRDELTETNLPNDLKGLPKETKVKVTAYNKETKGEVYDTFTTTIKLLDRMLKNAQSGTLGKLTFEFEVIK